MGTLRYLIATPSNGECEVLASQDDETLLPLASVFKLYVLGALVEAVDGGGITWDDPVTVRDELVSLGEGPMAEVEPGTTLPVRQLALWMIRESDNTATDHLMDIVGREAVEQIQLENGTLGADGEHAGDNNARAHDPVVVRVRRRRTLQRSGSKSAAGHPRGRGCDPPIPRK